MHISDKIKKRFKSQLLAQVISAVVGAALTIILARLLTPDGYGLLSLAIAIFGSVRIIGNLGIPKSTSRYIAKYKEKDLSAIPGILRAGFMLNIIVLTITILIYLISLDLVNSIYDEPGLLTVLYIGIGFIFVSSVSNNIRIILQGFEEIVMSSKLFIVEKITRGIFVLLLVILGYGVIGALVGYIVSYTIVSIVGTVYIYKSYYFPQNNTLKNKMVEKIAKYSVPITATSTAEVLDSKVDTLLVGFFLTPSSVAFFAVAKQIERFIGVPMTALGFTVSPSFESEKSKGRLQSAARIYENSLSNSLLLYIPACVGLIIVSELFIRNIFGDSYAGAIPVLQVFSIYALVRAISKVTSNGLDFLGRAKIRALIRSITAIMNVLLNIFLIMRLGVVGAAIATVVTYSIYTISNVYVMSIELPIQWKDILRTLIGTSTATVVMVIVIYPMSNISNGLVSLFATIFIGVIVWGCVIHILDVRDLKSLVVEF